MKRHLLTVLMGSIIAFIYIICLTFPNSAEASIKGDIIEWKYYLDDGIYTNVLPGSFEAGDLTSVSNLDEILTMSASDSQLFFSFRPALAGPFEITKALPGTGPALDKDGLYIESGILFTDTNDKRVINSVSLLSTNMTDSTGKKFSDSNITWNSHNIAIEWGGFQYAPGTEIIINIGTLDTDGPPTSVPEPATMLLFGSGLAGLLAGKRMFKR